MWNKRKDSLVAVFSLEEKMKFIDRKISESYYQLYIIFDVKEKKEYLDIVKKDLLNYKLEELQKEINLYKSILDNSKSDQSKEKYHEFLGAHKPTVSVMCSS